MKNLNSIFVFKEYVQVRGDTWYLYYNVRGNSWCLYYKMHTIILFYNFKCWNDLKFTHFCYSLNILHFKAPASDLYLLLELLHCILPLCPWLNAIISYDISDYCRCIVTFCNKYFHITHTYHLLRDNSNNYPTGL